MKKEKVRKWSRLIDENGEWKVGNKEMLEPVYLESSGATLSYWWKKFSCPVEIVINEKGQVAVGCMVCREQDVRDRNWSNEPRLMEARYADGEDYCVCPRCGATGPIISAWGDNMDFEKATVITGADLASPDYSDDQITPNTP